jgi:hypothetical protein
MSDAPLDLFLELSAVLTGFSRDEIDNPLAQPRLSPVYLALVRANAASELDALLAAFVQAKTQSGGDPAKLQAAVAAAIWNDETLGGLAKDVTRLWYLGRWRGGPYVSTTAYLQSLAWTAMDAKPIGYSAFTFGYWAQKPAASGKV